MNDIDIYKQLDAVQESVKTENDKREAQLLELLKAVSTGENDADGALRVVELMELTGWSDTRVRTQLKRLVKLGIVEHVDLRIESLDKKMRPSSGYRLVEKP
jgi:DNA-binding GntR family transcriptional regulator